MTKWKVIFCIHLISAMSAVFGLEVTMSQASQEANRGDDVTITCNFKPKNQVNHLIIITWIGDADGALQKVVFGTYYSDKNLVDIGPEYEGKASIVTDLNNRQSMLTLKQVSAKESRRIRCYIQIPGDNDGQTSDTTTLLVQVPPSQPICKIIGTAEYGHNISLTCVSEEGSPTPTYKWESYDVKNVPRRFPPKTTEKDGVLSLVNVSMETSGFYVCLSSNKIGSAKCNLTLSVLPPSMNLASTIGILGGCIAGIILLIIVICCCCRKRKKKPEEIEVGPVVEYHDQPQLASVEEENEDKANVNTEERVEKITYDDRKGSRDDLKDQYNDRRENRDDVRDHHDYRKGSRDDLRDRNDDRRGSRDELRDHYDYRKGSRDDLRDRYDDRRDHYDERKGSRDDLRDRYDDRRERYDDRKGSRDDLRDRYDDRRDRYDDRRGSRDNLRDHYDDRRGSRDDLRDRYDDQRKYYRDS